MIITNFLKETLVRFLPGVVIRQLRKIKRKWTTFPPVGAVNWGSFRRVTPISKDFGFSRGLPIDRYYIEQFLIHYAVDIQGRVLEIGRNTYTKKFGKNRVTKVDILNLANNNPEVTIVADLCHADHIPSNSFNCIILTQTLNFIFDFRAALRHIFRILKPKGVLLATLPGISQISRDVCNLCYDHWRFTTASAQQLFEEFVPEKYMEVQSYGNVLTSLALLHGLACSEIKSSEFEYHDPDYQIVITVRAKKPSEEL